MTQPDPDIARNLQSLREAAAARDWRGYYAALSPLLACLPAADAVEFVLAQLRAYLPRFGACAPDVTWPRKRLHTLDLQAGLCRRAPASGCPTSPRGSQATHFIQAMRYCLAGGG
jgi:hypothetical protein